MPEQVSLTDYGLVITTTPQQTKSDRDWNPGELKARIVVLEPAIYGYCSICKRLAVLSFCVRYLDGEANVVFWGEICAACASQGRRR